MATSQAISQMSTLAGTVNNDNCLFTIYNALISSSASQNRKVRLSTHEQFFSNNNTVVNQVTYTNYFGTGVNGSVTVSSSAQISSSTSPAGLNNTAFGDIVVKNFQNLTINSGVLFSPLNACRGLLIYCTGNLTVNGTISMTGKGGGVVTKIASPIGIAPVTDTRFDLIDATLYFNNFSSSAAGGRGIPTHWNWAPSGSAWFSNYKIRIPLSGSVAGGVGGAAAGGVGGTGTAGVFCCGSGGGGGGGSPGTGAAGKAGGRGTIFSGGGGGGGASFNNIAPGSGGTIGTLEAGGNGDNTAANSTGGGGGAGNPAGSGGNSSPGATATAGTIGAGGLLIIIVRGNVTVNGTISSNGSAGGNSIGTTSPSTSNAGGGGGGSGGGRILIIYGGTYTNVGSVVANGGSGGTSTGGGAQSGAGGAGGAGAITIRKVNT